MKKWKGLKKIIAGLLTVTILFTSMQLNTVEGATATDTSLGTHYSPNQFIDFEDNLIVTFSGWTQGWNSEKYKGYFTSYSSSAQEKLKVVINVDGKQKHEKTIFFNRNDNNTENITITLDTLFTRDYEFESGNIVSTRSVSNNKKINQTFDKYYPSKTVKLVSGGTSASDGKYNTLTFNLKTKSSVVTVSNNDAAIVSTEYSYARNHETVVDKVSLDIILQGKSAVDFSTVDFNNTSNFKKFSGNVEYYYSCVKVDGKIATKLKKEGNIYYALVDESWINLSEKKLRIYYRKGAFATNPISTVDTSELIKINVFNYNNNDASDSAINSFSRTLYFLSEASDTKSGYINRYSGSKAITEIVKKTLKDGYPVVDCSNQSLAYLFDTNAASGKTTIVSNATNLFSFNSETGEYSFDSTTQKAELDVNSGRFTVSNQNGQFYPFRAKNQNYPTEHASFGMNVGFDFLQPKSGLVNSEAMRFTFSGDDDVWIFVDGVLSLDLGGIHGNASGYIDFSNGQIIYTDSDNVGHNTTLYDAFAAAGKTEAELKEIFTENGLFKNYTNHHLEMFYLERGAGESNCKLQFNLPVIDSDSLYVTKEVLASDDLSIDEKAEYSFNLYKDGILVRNGSFNILENGVATGVSGTIDANGVFKLRDGQTAEFVDIQEGTKYVVKEINVPTDCSVYFGNQIQQIVDGTVSTPEKTFKVGEVNSTTFTNVFVSSKKDYNKTVVVNNSKDRTYEIELKADISVESVEISEETTKTPVDVVLVLDGSKSMLYQGDLTYLKTTTLSAIRNEMPDDVKNGKIYVYSKEGDPYKVFYSYDTAKSSLDEYMGLNSNDTYKFYYSESAGKYTRKSAVLSAVSETLNSLAEIGNCNIAVTMFAGESGKHLLKARTVTNSNKDSLLKTITDKYSLSGGTYPSLGLDLAYDALVNYNDYPRDYSSFNYRNDTISKSTNAKYVILLTDGVPSSTDEIDDSIYYAGDVKETGAVLYTVGLDMENIMSTVIKSNYTVENFLSDLSSGEGYVKSSSSNELNGVFASLIKEIKKENFKTEYAKGEVRDYIDPNFEIVTKSESGYEVAKDGDLINGGTVHISDNETYISWPTQELKEFDKKILVRAKDSFFGGNAVYTNGNKSGIYVNETIKYVFDQPLVNVPIVNLTGSESEKTVFIQDEVVPKAYYEESNALFSGIPSDCMLDKETINTLISEKEIKKTYKNYDGTDLGQFVYKFEADANAGEHTVLEAGVHKENFNITVTYVPSTVADRLVALKKDANTAVADQSTLTSDDVTVSAKYHINVVEGQIDIVKNLTLGTIYSKEYEGDPIFTFQIDKYTDANHKTKVATFYRTVRFEEAGKDSVKAEVIEHLGKGYYVITELNSQRYENADKTNIINVDFDEADIKAFDESDAEAKKDGYVFKEEHTITNTKKGETGKQTDTDVVMNRYVKVGNEWHVVAETVPQNPGSNSGKNKETVNNEFAALPTKKTDFSEGNN